MNNDLNNDPMVDAVAGQPASRRGFRGCTGFAVQAVACVALLFAGPLPSAQAQTTRTWNNSVTTGLWSNTGSWLGGVVPASTTDIAAFSSTDPGLVLTATGAVTPSIGQLYFDNAGTTTLQLNRITLNSGTGIIVTANSGNVFISNTSIGTSSNNPVIIPAAQIWENNSTSGTLSVQTAGVGTINNASGLTLRGPGAFRLGGISSTGMLTYEGTGLLTLTGGNGGSFTLNSSGTVRNESNVNTFLGAGTTRFIGGAIQQVGTGTSFGNFLLDGGFSLVSGTLWLNNNNKLLKAESNSNISVSNDSLLVFGSPGGDAVFLTGAGQITKKGFGAMSLSRVTGTGFSGGFKLEEGTLLVEAAPNNNAGASSLLGTGTFTIAGGTISSGRGQGGTLTQPSRFESNVVVGGTASFNLGTGIVTLGIDNPTINVVDPAVTFTIGGPIVGGTNGLTKSGPGRMILTGSSTYTGLTTVSSGSLWLGYGRNDNEGGTTGSVDGDIANNAMLVFNRINAQTYGGVISGSGNLTKREAQTLTLNGVNTFSGTTTVSSGAISLGNASALQNSGIDTAGAGTITAPTSQTSLTIGGLIGSKNFSGVFTTNLTGLNSLTLNPQAGRSFSYSGVIGNRTSGTTALTKTGAGEQILTGLNTFSGQTTVAEGTLTVNRILNSGNNSPLGTNGTVNFGGSSTSGLLRYTGSGETTTRVFNLVDGSGGGGIENNGSGALVISSNVTAAGSGSRVFRLMGTNTGANRIAGIAGTNVSVEKSGVGTWELSGVSTFTGSMTIAEGTVRIGVDNALPSSSAITIGGPTTRGFLDIDHALTISNLTFTGSGGDVSEGSTGQATFLAASGTALINVLSGSNAFHANATLSSPTLVDVNSGAYFSFHNNLAGGSSLTKSGAGTMNLTGDNDTLSGNLFVTGGMVTIGTGMKQIGTGTTTLSGGATIDLGGQSFTDRIVVLNGTILNAGGTATTTTIDGQAAISGSAAGIYNITSTGSAIFNTIVGSGTSQVNVYVNTDAGNGGWATFANDVGTKGNIVVNAGGTAAFQGTVAGSVTSHGASTFAGNVLSTSEVSVQPGGSGLFAAGMAGHANVDGTAIFSGAVSGTAEIFGSGTFGSTSSLTGELYTGPSATALLDNVSGTISAAIHNDGQLTIDRATGSQIISGVIIGTGTLTKTGAGQLTLTGENTFHGVTTVSGGTLQIGNGGAVGSIAGNIANNAAVVFNRSDALTYAAVMSGGGSLTKQGAGRLTLTTAQSFSGATTVLDGILEISNGGAVNSTSSVTVNGLGAEFKYNSSTSFNQPLTLTQGILSGTGTINTAVSVGSNAVISPGNSPGSQPYLSSEWLENGTYQWELNAMTGVAGTNWDKVVVSNLLNLTGLSASNKFNLNLTTLSGSNTAGPLDVGYVSGPTYIFPFVDFNSLSVGGTFSNTANSDLTALFNISLTNWQGTKPQAKDISVKVNSGGTGLNLVIVPEPATIALAAIGIGTAVWFFSRRRAA